MSDPVTKSNLRCPPEVRSSRIVGARGRPAIRYRALGSVRHAGAGASARNTARPAVDHYSPRLRAVGTHMRDAGWHWTSNATRGNGVELNANLQTQVSFGQDHAVLHVRSDRIDSPAP